MEPMQRIMVIRLLEKMHLDREMANRLQISDASGYKRKGGEKYENINKGQ